MNSPQMFNINQIISELKRRPYWEIRGGFFNDVIATSSNGIDIELTIEELKQQYPGQSISIKSGELVNGKLPNNAKAITLVLPNNTAEDNNSVYVDINNQQPAIPQQPVFISGFGNTGKSPNFNGFGNVPNPQQNIEYMFTMFNGILSKTKQEEEVKRQREMLELEKRFNTQLFGLQVENSKSEINRQMEDLKTKEKELREMEKKINEDKDRIFPKIGELVKWGFNGLLNRDSGPDSKSVDNIGINNVPQTPKPEFSFKKVETAKVPLNGIPEAKKEDTTKVSTTETQTVETKVEIQTTDQAEIDEFRKQLNAPESIASEPIVELSENTIVSDNEAQTDEPVEKQTDTEPVAVTENNTGVEIVKYLRELAAANPTEFDKVMDQIESEFFESEQ